MKTYGRIAYEGYCREMYETKSAWYFIDQSARDGWEAAAEAVISEYESRKPDPEDPENE